MRFTVLSHQLVSLVNVVPGIRGYGGSPDVLTIHNISVAFQHPLKPPAHQPQVLFYASDVACGCCALFWPLYLSIRPPAVPSPPYLVQIQRTTPSALQPSGLAGSCLPAPALRSP